MIPTICIGDIHGSTYWKTVVKKNPQCRYIFLGDYLDPYKKIARTALLDNLTAIINLKKEHPDEVVLLLGNHDLHYITDKAEMCSRYDDKIAIHAEPLFHDNIDLFQYAHQIDNYIFTHAGISQYWFVNDFKGDMHKNIADQLNNCTESQEDALFACGFLRGGFHEKGGIFWADIYELTDPLQGYTQIVGHNRVDDIYDFSKDGGRIIFCDCLYNKHFWKI